MCNCFCRINHWFHHVSFLPDRPGDLIGRLSDGAVIGEIAASRKQSYGGFLKWRYAKMDGLWWINPMKSYSNGFGGTPIIPHFGEPPYAEILNVIHGQPMGCFFQVLGLFPWRTATIRNLAETALAVAVDVVHHCSGQSSSWQSLGKSHETHQNQMGSSENRAI